MDELLPIFKEYAYSGFSALNSKPPSDGEISRTLKVARAVVLRMLGSSVTELPLPDAQGVGDYGVQEAVLFLTQYYIQNRQFYQRILEIEVSGILSERQVQGFDNDLSKSVHLHIAGLISSARKSSDFIPQVG